jgi:hypothetical protein
MKRHRRWKKLGAGDAIWRKEDDWNTKQNGKESVVTEKLRENRLNHSLGRWRNSRRISEKGCKDYKRY